MKSKIIGYAIGPVGSGLLGLVTLPILTWFYSAEDIGRISMLQVISSFSVMLFCLGMDQAYVREYYESKNTPKLFIHSIFLGFIFITLSYGILFLASPTLLSKWLYGISSKTLSALSITCFILALISRFLSLILRMEERPVAYSMSQLLPKVLFLVFILSSLLLSAKKDTLNIILAHTLAVFSTFIIFAWNTRKEWINSFYQNLDKKLIKKLLHYGLPLIVGSLAAWGLNVMDRFFLRSFSTFTELGIYSVSMSIASGATIIASIFNTIWAPLVLKWHKDGIDIKKIDNITEYVLAVIVFITILVSLFSWLIPYFLPDKYKPIQYLLPICLLGPLFYTLSETSAVGINISRKTIYSMFASVGAMLVNALGNYLLVPSYGALGAASSTAIAFSFFYFLRTEFSSIVWRKIPRIKNYIFTIILTSLTICFGFFGYYNKKTFYLLWTLLTIISFLSFKKQIKYILFK